MACFLKIFCAASVISMTSKSQKAPVFLLDGTGSASPILDDRLATSVQRVLNNIKALDFHTAHQVIPNYAMFYPTPEEHDVIYEKFGDQLVMAVDGSVAIASARESVYMLLVCNYSVPMQVLTRCQVP